jgi:hypothetical protein
MTPYEDLSELRKAEASQADVDVEKGRRVSIGVGV